MPFSVIADADYPYYSTLLDGAYGLSRTHIYDIEVDNSGYIWLATERGIIRYDRKNFIEIGLGDSLLENSVCKKISLTSTRLYAVFPQAGFSVINLKNYPDVYSERGMVTDITPVNEKEFAALYINGKVELRHNSKTKSAIDFLTSRPGIIQHFGDYLFLSLPQKGLYQLDLKTLHVIRTDDLVPTGFNASFVKIGQELVLLDDNTYYLFSGGKWIPRPQWRGLTGIETMTCLNELPGVGLLYNRFQKDVVLVQPKGAETILKADSISNLEYYSLGHAGNCFFAGTNQGLVLIRPRPNKPSIINDNLEDNYQHVRIRRRIIETKDHGLLLFGFPYTYRYKDGHISRLSETPRSSIDAVVLGDTAYFTSEGSGLEAVSLKTGQLRTIVRPGSLERKGFCYGLTFEPESNSFLVGHFGKVIRYSLSDQKATNHPLTTTNCIVRKIIRTHGPERYFIGTSLGLVVTDTNFHPITTCDRSSGLGGNMVSDLYFEPVTNRVYVAHNQGVDIVDSKSGKRKSSLFEPYFGNPNCVSITADKLGRLWIGTFTGIIGYDPESNSFIRLNRNNGLVNQEFNYASATCLEDGRIILGGLNCYDIIRPDIYEFGKSKSQGIISGYHLFSKKDTTFTERWKSNKISFNIDEDYLRIYLTSDGESPENLRLFEYSINQGPWIGSGGKSYMDVFHFDPGAYDIRFRSFDEFGNTLDFPSITVVATTPFYESRWFIWSLTGLTIIALMLYASSWSRHHRKMVALRNKIAMDLHDEVGSLLTYALYQSKTSSGQTSKNDLQHNLREAIYALRVYVKSIDDRKLGLEQLIDGLRDFIESSFPKQTFTVEFLEKHDANQLLAPELYRDIKLCFIELCTNILKHSDGNRVHIQFESADSIIRLRVSDNGTGNGETDSFNSGGSGSVNIQKRASRYGGKLTYSTPSDGIGLQAEVFFRII